MPDDQGGSHQWGQPQQPPAGWYADPNSPGVQRFWDGTAWTPQTQPVGIPVAGGAAQAVAASNGQRHWFRRAVFYVPGVIALVLIVVIAVAAGSKSNGSSGGTPTTQAPSFSASGGSTQTTAPPATSPPATSPPATSPPATSPPATSPPATSPPPTTAPGLTQQQQSAVEEAQQYLSTEAFSQQGLIDQLDSPDGGGYSVNDATVAVDSLTVDWNSEAVQAAKEYLAMEPFSCSDLIQQLDSPDGDQFTVAQATYGATQAGDC